MLTVLLETGPDVRRPGVPNVVPTPVLPMVELDPNCGKLDPNAVPEVPSVVKPRLDPTLERLLSGPVPIGGAPGAPNPPTELPPTERPVPPTPPPPTPPLI